MLKPPCVFLLSVVASAHTEMEGFIVGGSYANILHHPHSAFLNVYCIKDNGFENTWICGSSVVNQMILLTAAHCLHECNSNSHITINLGNEHRDRGTIFAVYSFVVHENFNPLKSSNDVCLLRVHRELTLTKKISRVAFMRHPPYSELAKVAGWGMVDEVRELQSSYLKFVSQKVISRSECLRIFGFMPEGTLCATSPKSKVEYPSQGDSGSALLVRGYIQIGLVSYKIPELTRDIVVYTDVGYFYDWIETYSKELFCV